MDDLSYNVSGAWNGTGPTGEGTLTIGGERLPYSVPANMGGKGTGGSPETLLIAAVTACYSATLYHFLTKRRLPVASVTVDTRGSVSGYPSQPRYSTIEVSPTIHGGDPELTSGYETAARLAREHCFIGQTVAAGGVSYVLGAVTVTATAPDGEASTGLEEAREA